MSETISYIIPGSTENEVNVPSEDKTDHADNSLQGGIDDFVSLSTSQTDIMLEEINTYESSQEKSVNGFDRYIKYCLIYMFSEM